MIKIPIDAVWSGRNEIVATSMDTMSRMMYFSIKGRMFDTRTLYNVLVPKENRT